MSNGPAREIAAAEAAVNSAAAGHTAGIAVMMRDIPAAEATRADVTAAKSAAAAETAMWHAATLERATTAK